MDDRQKRNFAFGLLLSILVFSSIFFFIFQNFLNKGTLIIEESNVSTPFFILEKRLGMQICENIPCEIKQFAGKKSFIFQKKGYKEKTIDTNVKFLRKTIIKLEMEIEPYLEKSGLRLDLSRNPYRLLTDSETGFQKLVDITDPIQKTIVYFPIKIENPSFVLQGKHLLILSSSDEPSLVNIETSEKLFIDSVFQNASNIVFSNDAKVFAFTNKNTETIFIFVPHLSKERFNTQIESKNTNYLVDRNYDLMLVRQDQTENKTIIEKYLSSSFEKTSIFESSQILDKIIKIHLTEEEKELFIQTEKELFKLVLKE